MILTIVAVLVLIWLIGLLLHILGGLINIIIIIAAIIFVYDVLIVRRRPPKE